MSWKKFAWCNGLTFTILGWNVSQAISVRGPLFFSWYVFEKIHGDRGRYIASMALAVLVQVVFCPLFVAKPLSDSLSFGSLWTKLLYFLSKLKYFWLKKDHLKMAHGWLPFHSLCNVKIRVTKMNFEWENMLKPLMYRHIGNNKWAAQWNNSFCLQQLKIFRTIIRWYDVIVSGDVDIFTRFLTQKPKVSLNPVSICYGQVYISCDEKDIWQFRSYCVKSQPPF